MNGQGDEHTDSGANDVKADIPRGSDIHVVTKPVSNGHMSSSEEVSKKNHFIKPLSVKSGSESPKKHSKDSSSKHSDKKSSSDKNKHSPSKHGSSKDKDRKHRHGDSSASDSGRSRDKDRDRKSQRSSSSSHKHNKDKHRDKDKHRSKDKVRLDGEFKVKSESVKVKSEPNTSPVKVKSESGVSPVKVRSGSGPSSGEETPRIKEKRKRPASSSEDDEPLSVRIDKAKKIKKEVKKSEKKRKVKEESDDDVPLIKRKKDLKDEKKKLKKEEGRPGKKKKKKEEEQEKWKWWEEERVDDGTKWKHLEHKGPVFAPDYEPLPGSIRFAYNGKKIKLSLPTEEICTFFGKMLDHDYTTKDIFRKNFFKDWRKFMTPDERSLITDLNKCNFNNINDYFKMKTEERKAMSKEEKLKIKEQNAALQEEYGFCIMDNHKEKIGNFRIEPPGLFRGRGDHPKMGMLKTRTLAEDIIINCSKGSSKPAPPKGHKWKEVRHDNTVSWLACWTENVQAQTKYIMLNAASKLKGEKDWQKYEIARKLHKCVDRIRAQYQEDWRSKEMRIRQRAVALYFIDKLALRAGNEKEDGETADTVGCCSLRVEHITLYEEHNGKENVVEFDFLGKDSIRYLNQVSVEKRVFRNVKHFMDNKDPEDDLFDRLNTSILNKHLGDLMEGLTAKVFRTYNASRTLQEQLKLLTSPDEPIAAKLLSYNRANRAVAILCNHQRAAPKNFDKQMENIQNKITDKKQKVKEAKKAIKDAKSDFKASKTEKNKQMYEKKKKAMDKLNEQLTKLEVQMTDKDENKEIALGTSKLNYLDPRISVAWCKKWDVPVEKIYNKTQRDKFAWAVEMVDEDFEF